MYKKRDFSEILSSELISITGGMIAGTLLAIFTDKLFLLPGLFILIPGFLELQNASSGSLAARLGTELHTRKIRPGKKSRLITENKMASFILFFLVSLILGVTTYLLTFFVFNQNYPTLLLVPLLAAIISSILLFPLTIRFTLWLYKHHHNPDNVMGPFITSLGDIEGVLSILVVLLILT